jgi:glycine oxidase
MLAVDGQPLSRAVMATCGYLIPRDGSLLVGATVEPGNFDAEPSTGAARELRGALRRMCPSLADAPERSRWAGVRPATPDMLPIIDRDPDAPSLIYACGHSKNGILLAPITGECVANLLLEKQVEHDLEPFSITRFRQ